MDKKFKVIKGTKYDPIDIEYDFLEGYVTDTRLMGVIGLWIKWERKDGKLFYQFFHLDAEEYGLDDYESVYGEDTIKIEKIKGRMMGGLGGKFVPVNEREAKYIIQSYVKKNEAWKEPLPESEWEYEFLLKDEVCLSKEEKSNLYEKLCEDIVSPFQLINYYIMRCVGKDEEAVDYLLSKDIDYKVVNRPSTLLKNIIEINEDSKGIFYLTESLIDIEKKYKMVVSEIRLIETENGLKVEDAQIKSMMKITSTEAAFALMRKEYLLVYHVKDMGKLIKLLANEKRHAMKNSYELGYLYTEFYPTNAHVNRQTYYLNEDVYGVYYITTGDQLIAAAYHQEKIREIQDYLMESEFGQVLELEEKIDLDHSLLYEFIHSDKDNIFDFLDEE
ncbi:hypothetical protein [Crassaminicella profunda]|uniref:hypothetical protein n=1 Tax=Crassaminicella profunda TaxID=1286698 RepID=UPI001CA7303E|nr:hypothetical protein [Crassaminicella profunda]QZY55576.1 hypothetical protein K7H06_00580 [Crassaminicella profunda]